VDEVRKNKEPFDRLTELAEQITGALDDPEYSDVKCIVFLEDAKKGGVKMHGYDDPISAMAALFVHMKAVFAAEGKDLDFIAIPDTTEGISSEQNPEQDPD
jgi:hypothetical protein